MLTKIYSIAFVCAALVLAPAVAAAKPFKVDNDRSHIRFAGTHAGNPFAGEFKVWKADIDFDASRPETSKIRVVIDMATAQTGDALYDKTLPSADWFNVKAHPTAVFECDMVSGSEKEGFKAAGSLSIRGAKVPVEFLFALDKTNSTLVSTQFDLSLDRLAFGIGEQSDPSAEWVGRDIRVSVALVAEVR